MKAIKFNLSGKTAFFKKTDVNQNVYFSYSHIHRITLLGILGSIIGLDGYSKQYEEGTIHPEFYEKLKKLRFSIVPTGGKNGYFNKKIVVFNNASGLATTKGETQNIREQWLLDVGWDIYILDDNSEEYKKIVDYLLNQKSVYIPYLGKNDHFAEITDAQLVELSKIDHVNYIHSLYVSEDENVIVEKDSEPYDNGAISYYFEYLPYQLDNNNLYKFKLFSYTNLEINIKQRLHEIYSYNDLNLMFI